MIMDGRQIHYIIVSDEDNNDSDYGNECTNADADVILPLKQMQHKCVDTDSCSDSDNDN